MNLRDLEYFVAVAELGHFSLAAERCFVSQPTLSGQLKKLEAELGQALFERNTRNVRLSPFGREILGLAKKALASTEEITQKALAQQDPFCGPVTLGAFPTLSPWLLPRLSSVFIATYPNTEFFLSEEKTPILLAQLETGELDMALLALPVEHSGIEVLPLFQESFLLAVPDSHPWAKRRSIQDHELSGIELLLLSDGHCLRDQALDLCYRYGAQERGQFRATSLETLRQMVRMGRGITLMPELAIPECAEPGICYLALEGGEFSRRIGLCYRSTHPRATLMRHVAASIKKLCGSALEVQAL